MKIWQWLAHFDAESESEIRETRPFFVIVTLVMGAIFALTVQPLLELHAPARLIPFAFLMLLHTVLYWLSPHFTRTIKQSLIYLAIQGGIAFALILLAANIGIILGLYPALIGMAVGILWRQDKRATIAVAAAFLVLTMLGFGLSQGRQAMLFGAAVAVPAALFAAVYVILYERQVDARDQAQRLLRELETAHGQLADYAERVQDLTLTTERQRMARELHDTLAQGLAGLILQLEAANSHLSSGHHDRAQVIVQQAMARARATLADARRAIDDLRQDAVAPSDLATSLHREANRFTTATGIACQVEMALLPALPDAICEHVLRVVAEGLTNIARHAQATQAWVNVAKADQHIEIEVRDNGIGFDPASDSAQPGHYGLLGMRERARLAGGTLEIASASGQGTRLKLHLPL